MCPKRTTHISYRLMQLPLLLIVGVQLAHAAPKAATNSQATSEIRHESNGYWLYIDGARKAALAGAVYQHTDGKRHVQDYTNSFHSLYAALDDKSAGGENHGARLASMDIQAIRIYQLPIENADDIRRTKEIFRRLYSQYGIKVLIGDWAGLHTGMNFQNQQDIGRLDNHLQKLVAAYCDEPWVLGWQIGNENNYHVQHGVLGQEINLSLPEYYSFMDNLAGVVKEQLHRRRMRQLVSLGQGELNTNDVHLIATMKNIDAVGINCYREDPNGFDAVITLAANQLRVPIYFAEVGRPGEGALTEQQQSEYLKQVCSLVFSHEAGDLHFGNVIGVFLHEATDEKWKQFETGHESDARYGILDKSTERELGNYLKQHHAFSTWILPTNDAPDTLIQSAWQCLEGPFAHRYYRAYGNAMTYASRAIALYQDQAQAQENELKKRGAPLDAGADSKLWALNSVGTGYFIIGDALMLQSYDFAGNERPDQPWKVMLKMANVRPVEIAGPDGSGPVMRTNSAGCRYYARQVFSTLRDYYPHAHLREADGTYDLLQLAVRKRFPELSKPYVPFTLQAGSIFTGACLFVIIGSATLSSWRSRRKTVKSKSALSPSVRALFLLALAFNLACLYWFATWWFDPVRLEYYTVQPVLFWMLTAIGTLGVAFYFQIWRWLWNMRRPVPMPPPEGLRVAIVTTRVGSETIESIEGTLKKMSRVEYPHDSYLLDEANSDEAKAACEKWGIIHFSRKDNPNYNQPSGAFQARTKGGNLNSWLYEHGQKYEFVTFLDPDHAPRPEFLHKVLGYFQNGNVGFVQGPQVFHNQDTSWVARGGAEQSYLFYGPIQMGLFGINSCVVNGSHSTFRISTLFSMRGKAYAVHDADDILTSIRIHALGQHGVYVPEVIAEGLVPDTWEEFSKQQRRWAYSMFHLLFHFYGRELRRVPLRTKMVYLTMASFYFRGVAFAGLLLLPFISGITGNPPVNADITAFCLRYFPFFLLHFGILLFLGQRFLIPKGSRRGFWYRAGILWVAMWWEHLRALTKAIFTRRVTDRVVAAKGNKGPVSPWRAVLPHTVLALGAAATFAWVCALNSRRETVWGTLFFLGVVLLSQGFIVVRLTGIAKRPARVARKAPVAGPIMMQPAFGKETRKL